MNITNTDKEVLLDYVIYRLKSRPDVINALFRDCKEHY